MRASTLTLAAGRRHSAGRRRDGTVLAVGCEASLHAVPAERPPGRRRLAAASRRRR